MLGTKFDILFINILFPACGISLPTVAPCYLHFENEYKYTSPPFHASSPYIYAQRHIELNDHKL